MATFSGISWPFLRMALSNTMPSADSFSPLLRCLHSVTCPTSLDPLGITTWPSDFVASVVLAVTASPGLFFLASTGCDSAAFIVVPLDNAPEPWPDLAAVAAEVLLEAFAPDLSACTEALLFAEALACAPPWAYTAQQLAASMPPRMTTDVAFIK